LSEKPPRFSRRSDHQEIASPAALPDRYRLLTIAVEDGLRPLDTPPLPSDWRERTEATRAVGDAWLANSQSALLRVPSAIMPDVHNILLNPLHPDAGKLRLTDVQDVPFDPRLFKSKRYERTLLPEVSSVAETARGFTGDGGHDGRRRQASSQT